MFENKKSGIIEKSMDALNVGTVVVFRLPAITDENHLGYCPKEIVSDKDIKEIKKSVDKTEPLIGVIRRRIETDDGMTFDVAFFTRRHDGTISGYIELKEVMIWRYFVDPCSSGIPPKWFKEIVRTSQKEEGYFVEIPADKIHYLKDCKKKPKYAKVKYIVKDEK